MVDAAPLRVLFAHGLESSPQGSKARLFAEHFTALTPSMNTRDIESCIAVHTQAIRDFRPDVVVGSSFGGAVVVALLMRGAWRGPTLLLAQAAYHYDRNARLPDGVPVTLVHALEDDVVAIDESRRLASTGKPACVELIERNDDHALTAMVSSGELVALTLRAAAKVCVG
jgi:hypothetical protein